MLLKRKDKKMKKKKGETIKKNDAKEVTQEEMRKAIRDLKDDEILVCRFMGSDKKDDEN